MEEIYVAGKTRDLGKTRDFRLLPSRVAYKKPRKNPRPPRLPTRFYSATSKTNPRLPPDTAAFPPQNGSGKPATFTLSYASVLRGLGGVDFYYFWEDGQLRCMDLNQVRG